MNIQMMEGLLGANSNIKLSGTPMSVYRQASAEGDTEKMKRAEEGAEPGRPRETDLMQISGAATAALKNNKPAEAVEPIDSEPVIYTPAGEVSPAPVEPEPTVSFTAQRRNDL